MALLLTKALATVPATAGAVRVAWPDVEPANAKIPLLVPINPTVSVGAMKLNCVLVLGAAPAPPPSTTAVDASARDDAHAVPLEKYGIPPEVPATVNAGVVVGVATEIKPPVNATEVTVPVPAGKSAVTSARKVGAPVPPVAGPANTEFCAALSSVKVSTGVVVGVATDVVKSGLSAPALNVVTVPVGAAPLAAAVIRPLAFTVMLA
jgi:hypothetical protein